MDVCTFCLCISRQWERAVSTNCTPRQRGRVTPVVTAPVMGFVFSHTARVYNTCRASRQRGRLSTCGGITFETCHVPHGQPAPFSIAVNARFLPAARQTLNGVLYIVLLCLVAPCATLNLPAATGKVYTCVCMGPEGRKGAGPIRPFSFALIPPFVCYYLYYTTPHRTPHRCLFIVLVST